MYRMKLFLLSLSRIKSLYQEEILLKNPLIPMIKFKNYKKKNNNKTVTRKIKNNKMFKKLILKLFLNPKKYKILLKTICVTNNNNSLRRVNKICNRCISSSSRVIWKRYLWK